MEGYLRWVDNVGEWWRVKKWEILILLLAAALLVWAMAIYLPPGVDWHLAFRPAALKLLSGHSPYEVDGYFNAPWALIPLLPLALLPEAAGRAILVLVSLIGYTYVAQRLGAGRLTVAVFLLSPPVLHGLLNANVDWLAMLGFVMPPQIGLFFLLTKPQVGIGVVVYWLVDTWVRSGWREVVRIFWPVTAALAISFAFFGLWPLRFGQEVELWWNASLWPGSIPVGIALLAAAIRTRKMEYAMGAGPCLSPYVLLHAWAGALVAIIGRRAEFLAAVAGLWILFLMRAFG